MGRQTVYPFEGGEATVREVHTLIKGLYGYAAVEMRLQRGCDTRAKVLAYCGKAASTRASTRRNQAGLTPGITITPSRHR